jgi:sec-independent protein translocase protein TatA
MELIVVLVIAVVVLGPKRLPDVGRSVGQGMREFRQSLSGKEQQPALAASEQPDE